jgi:hypothetical protein
MRDGGSATEAGRTDQSHEAEVMRSREMVGRRDGGFGHCIQRAKIPLSIQRHVRIASHSVMYMAFAGRISLDFTNTFSGLDDADVRFQRPHMNTQSKATTYEAEVKQSRRHLHHDSASS